MRIASTAVTTKPTQHNPTQQKNVQRAFDRAAHHYYDHCYGQSATSLQEQAARLLVNELKPQANMEHLIDLGCGMGVHWPVLQPLAEYYTGIDLSPEMIKEAYKRCQPDKQKKDT